MPNKYAAGTTFKKITLQQSLKDRLDATAKEIGVSANQFIIDAIEHDLDHYDKILKKPQKTEK